MIAAMVFREQVVGGGLLLGAWSLCAAAYLIFGLARRRGKGRRWLLAGLLAAEALTDLFCLLVFFPGGEYHNWGVGGVYAAALWPMALLTAYVLSGLLGAEDAGNAARED